MFSVPLPLIAAETVKAEELATLKVDTPAARVRLPAIDELPLE
jgi:hypothetical protein